MEEIKIHFTTEREKVDKMKKRTYEILDEIRNNAFSEDNFKKVYVPLVVDQETEQKAQTAMGSQEETDPLLWLAILNAYVEGNQQIAKEKPEVVDYRTITRQDVADIINKLLDGAKKREIVVKSKPLQSTDF